MSRYSFQKSLYNGLVLPVVYGAVSLAAPFHRKLRDTLAARRNVRARWQAARKRFDGRPIWFHVSSVGEYEQARPVITKLGKVRPDIPIAVSFTSPSGYEYATRREEFGNGNNIRFMDYLPIDFADNARFCIDTLDPRLIVFVKFDLWPNLIWQAAGAGVPMVLIDATLSESSQRLSGIGRHFYRALYDDIGKILAISDGDADRFSACAPGHTGISVAGDTRFDRVMERKRSNGSQVTLDAKGRFVVIAGSTWPRDEEHLLPALSRLTAKAKQLLLILAPHEPTPEHIEPLARWAGDNNIPVSMLSAHPDIPLGDRHHAIIVDSVGNLAELYRFADMAYVGGAFGTGVHSVLEPAIMGLPVLFGPAHKNSFEAIELLRNNAAFETRNDQQIYEFALSIYENDDLRETMGNNARRYVESQLGATDRCVERMSAYL